VEIFDAIAYSMKRLWFLNLCMTISGGFKMNGFKHIIFLTLAVVFVSSCSKPYVSDVPRVPYGWHSGDVNANGIRLHYYRTGDGTKPAILMLHGYTDNGLCWTDLAHELEKDYDVIMMDYRGHGFSDAPQGEYKTEDYTADAVGLIEELKLKKPIVIGHSMGGSIAAVMAVERPDIPQKIVLIDPPGVVKPLFENDAKKKEALQWFKKDIKHLHNASLDTLLKEAARRHPAISEQARLRWADAKVQMKPQIAETVINLPCLRDEWPKIAVPTLILKADADEKTKQEELDAVKNLPNITLVHIAGAGHLVHLERPEASLAELRKFLAK
jgi:N-formylmaleamate deformylase